MKLINESALKEARRRLACEWCSRPTPHGAQPHHIRARGAGGAFRVDHRLNLVSLCIECHADAHSGKLLRDTLIAVVASREGMLFQDVADELERLRWAISAPKEKQTMAVRKVGQKQKRETPKRVTCRECGAILAYLAADVKRNTQGREYIDCVTCKMPVEVKG